jgi:acyl dehydratase
MHASASIGSPFTDAVRELEIGRTFTGCQHRLTRTDFVRYAGISGDFNPMHHDETRAQAAGEPSVFGHGMYSAGLLANDLAELAGLRNLLSYRVRFTSQSRPGQQLHSEIRIVAVRKAGPGWLRAEVSCLMGTETGDVVVRGSAKAAVALDGTTGCTPPRSAANATDPPPDSAGPADSSLRAGMRLAAQRVHIEQGPVAVFADVIGARSDIYRSTRAARAAGYSGIPVPPTFGFIMATWGAHADLQPARPADPAELADLTAVSTALAEGGGLLLHGEQEFSYHRPLIVGETLDTSGVVLAVTDKLGSGQRPLRLARLRLEARDEDGELALTQVMTLVCRR